MDKLLCGLLLLLSAAAHGQSAGHRQGLSVAFSISPDYNYRTLGYTSGNSAAATTVASRNATEVHRAGYTAAVLLRFHWHRQLTLEAGLHYALKGYRNPDANLIFQQPDPTAPLRARMSYAYRYLGVPVRLQYAVGSRKIRLLLAAGVQANWLLQQRQTITLSYANGQQEERRQSATGSFNRLELAPMVSIGADAKLSDRWRLAVEPCFRYGLTNTRTAPVQEKLWSAGVAVSLAYRLR
jgi:hypothetical protein